MSVCLLLDDDRPCTPEGSPVEAPGPRSPYKTQYLVFVLGGGPSECNLSRCATYLVPPGRSTLKLEGRVQLSIKTS